jgi:hypothetical protein
MLQALVSHASRLLSDLNRSLLRSRSRGPEIRESSAAPLLKYRPLKRVLLTDGVGHTLFEEFGEHSLSSRGEEETGWVLLGLRNEDEAVVLATLPAGAERDAGAGHVQFNSWAQALGSRIVRQSDRRLVILGVVHTHPGSLRHPSDGDYRGDTIWVGQLRGKEGIFGIGTVDATPGNGTAIAQQPKPNVQCFEKLRLSWYALAAGDRHYRPLPIGLTLGPDLARPLHCVWPIIESHASRLDRLCRQQAGVSFEVVPGEKNKAALAVHIPVAEPPGAIRVLLEDQATYYYLVRNGETLRADPKEARVDRAVYLLLAELAVDTD